MMVRHVNVGLIADNWVATDITGAGEEGEQVIDVRDSEDMRIENEHCLCRVR